ARMDRYSDFGHSTNPELGFEWHPARNFSIHGTYARAFKAPTLYNLYSSDQTVPNFVVDPTTGQQAYVPVRTGGKASVGAETGHSETLGLSYASDTAPDLQVSLTPWRIKQEETIQSVSGQYIVDNESTFPGRVTRDSAGNIVLVDATYTNFGSIDVAGID